MNIARLLHTPPLSGTWEAFLKTETMNKADEIEATSNYMEVQEPGRIQPEYTVTTAGTGTMIIKPKSNRKSYKTELKAMTKERNRWRRVALALIGFTIGSIATQLLFLN